MLNAKIPRGTHDTASTDQAGIQTYNYNFK